MSCANEHVHFKLEPFVNILIEKMYLIKYQYVSNGFLQGLLGYINEFSKCHICTKYILAEIKHHEYYFPAGDLDEDLDFIDGTAADSVIAPCIKKISKILQRLKINVSDFSGTTEHLLSKSIAHLEDLDKLNEKEKCPSVYKQIFIGIMLLIKIILASI